MPFSPEAAPSTLPTPADAGDNNLHERLYQTATVRWRRLGRGSESFHELEDSAAAARGINDSVCRWASGRSESGIGGVALVSVPSGWWLMPN